MRCSSVVGFFAVAVGVVVAVPASASDNMVPVCPVGYDTYCCNAMFPNNIARAWMCTAGPGKVSSIDYCLNKVVEQKQTYCKRPGDSNFGTLLRWSPGTRSFVPVLEPRDFKFYLQPGDVEPWVPRGDQIDWVRARDWEQHRHEQLLEQKQGELRRRAEMIGEFE